MMDSMGPVGESGAVAGRVAGPGMVGVVCRPRLFERLESARVTVVAASAGSGKTVLLRSWMSAVGLADRTAWVTVGQEERDPQRFWISVIDALRGTSAGSGLVRPLTAAPDLDGWAVVERLLKDLAALHEWIWLVLDDVHELSTDLALRQLQLLVMRAPPKMRFVLATRHDLQLGLHRLRLEGELTEIRARDLRFSLAETRDLLAAAGVELSGPTLRLLVERAEGWAAGLRLAALSLARHPDPERLAAEFSGSERTVAEYLLAEVLDRQPEQVRRLLLRTSVLERVSGEVADALTGGSGGDRILHELEEANAFVVALDSSRSWFRYHRLLAGLLQLQLRRTAPDEVIPLHELAAEWFADHGFPVEATRHAQAAEDWDLAVRLLADHWPRLHLDGQAATVHVLLAGFPAEAAAMDAELAALSASDELAQGSLEAAERYVQLAESGSASLPPARRGHVQVLLGMVRLLLARQRSDLSAVVEEAQRLQLLTETPGTEQFGLGGELRALALVNLGITELWAGRFEEAERHLERGVSLAHRIGRPFLELNGLAHLTTIEALRSFPRTAERGGHAVELARRHGWTDEPAASIVYMVLGATLAYQGQFEEAESWVERAERTVRAEAEPATGATVRFARGLLELARGRCQEALGAFRAAVRLAGVLTEAEVIMRQTRSLLLHALVRLGDTDGAEQALAGMEEQDRESGEMRIAAAALRLALDDAPAATAALAPVLDGSASLDWPNWLAEAFLLEAMSRDALGDRPAAGRALERAFDLAEPDGVLSLFLLHPAPSLLERNARHLSAHATMLAEIRSRLVGEAPAPPATGPQPLLDPVSKSELRVLRYLPTHLSAQEIAGELYVSANTVKTHMRSLYAKLGAHTRTEVVDRARALGLLAAPFRKP